MSQKMTDEQWQEALIVHAGGHTWNKYTQDDVVAHIAALTAERDGEHAERVKCVEARRVANTERETVERERDALRERVKALAHLERDNASLRSRLAAIRKRACTIGLAQEEVRHILGEDTPAPSELDGLRGEMVEQTAEEARAELEADGVDVPAFLGRCRETVRRARAGLTTIAPTTAVAFAKLRAEHAAWTDDAKRVLPLLSLLERRMAAQDAALRRYLAQYDEKGGPTPDIDILRAALADAPPVFTLEEVRSVVHKLGPLSTEYVMEALAALRR